MFNKRLFYIILITLSLGLNILFPLLYFLSRLELKVTENKLIVQKSNDKALSFAKLFVDKFLLGQGTIEFEDRLKLENAVRDINDPEIFKQWQKFTNSADDSEAQRAAGQLLNLLFSRLEK